MRRADVRLPASAGGVPQSHRTPGLPPTFAPGRAIHAGGGSARERVQPDESKGRAPGHGAMRRVLEYVAGRHQNVESERLGECEPERLGHARSAYAEHQGKSGRSSQVDGSGEVAGKADGR